VIQLPIQFVKERFLTPVESQSLFVRQSSIFEDIVIRCVRYAFANIPTNVGRVFFSGKVALPFLRWRMLRHGLIKSPVYWRECSLGQVGSLRMLICSRPMQLTTARDRQVLRVSGSNISQSKLLTLSFTMLTVSNGNQPIIPGTVTDKQPSQVAGSRWAHATFISSSSWRGTTYYSRQVTRTRPFSQLITL
jgi:hypothetical protein